jgi:hypothetical protein
MAFTYHGHIFWCVDLALQCAEFAVILDMLTFCQLLAVSALTILSLSVTNRLALPHRSQSSYEYDLE